MKNIAIICEYNPMHNGHIYQIKKIKERFPNSNIIALMSSSFVQRGEPSVLNKFTKSTLAIKNGVDLVLEMPTIISIQSANYFAFYSVLLLDKLKNIDYLAFGIEEKDEKLFIENINNILNNQDKISKIQKEYLDNGLSYKNSYLNALSDLGINDKILRKPNNTLAIQYILSLKKINSNIKYLPITREDGGYNSKNLDEHKFQSATTIRALYKKEKDFKKYVPQNIFEALSISEKYDLNQYNTIFYFISKIEKRSPKNVPGYENGMLNLLIKNYENNLSELVESSHNKRYSKSRIQRFIINYLLDIKTKDIDNLYNISYIRPLGFNDKGASILKNIKNMEEIEIVQNINIKPKSSHNQRFLDIDKNAFLLHQLLYPNLEALDYIHIPYIRL